MEMRDKIRLWILEFAGELRVDDLNLFLKMASDFDITQSLEMEKDIGGIKSDSSLSDREKYEYEGYIRGMYEDAGGAVDVAYSMSIVALHSRVEVTRKKIVECVFPDLDSHKLSNISYVIKKVVPRLPEIGETDSIKELRLTNNSIKHNEGKVSEELAKHIRMKKGEHLIDLDQTYSRLIVHAKEYISAVASAAKLHL